VCAALAVALLGAPGGCGEREGEDRERMQGLAFLRPSRMLVAYQRAARAAVRDGHGLGADWLIVDNPLRDRQPRTQRLLARAAVVPGMDVVDVGAGAGYFTFRFAELVGPTGTVLATDSDAFMYARLQLERDRRGATNVRAHLTLERWEVGLPTATADLLFLVNAFLFADCLDPADQAAWLADAARVLRPGGRLLISDDRIHGNEDCRGLAADDIARAADPWFTLITSEELPVSKAIGGASPGFLLLLGARRAAGAEHAAPTERVPTERAPTERVPTERVPTERVPTERVPTERVPTERVPTERVPTE
jgi:SAM-dependent methyltransferase